MSAGLADGRDAAERACGALACDIQFCLQRHGYQMAPCRDVVAAHEACVREERARAAAGGAAAATRADAAPPPRVAAACAKSSAAAVTAPPG